MAPCAVKIVGPGGSQYVREGDVVLQGKDGHHYALEPAKFPTLFATSREDIIAALERLLEELKCESR